MLINFRKFSLTWRRWGYMKRENDFFLNYSDPYKLRGHLVFYPRSVFQLDYCSYRPSLALQQTCWPHACFPGSAHSLSLGNSLLRLSFNETRYSYYSRVILLYLCPVFSLSTYTVVYHYCILITSTAKGEKSSGLGYLASWMIVDLNLGLPLCCVGCSYGMYNSYWLSQKILYLVRQWCYWHSRFPAVWIVDYVPRCLECGNWAGSEDIIAILTLIIPWLILALLVS